MSSQTKNEFQSEGPEIVLSDADFNDFDVPITYEQEECKQHDNHSQYPSQQSSIQFNIDPKIANTALAQQLQNFVNEMHSHDINPHDAVDDDDVAPIQELHPDELIPFANIDQSQAAADDEAADSSPQVISDHAMLMDYLAQQQHNASTQGDDDDDDDNDEWVHHNALNLQHVVFQNDENKIKTKPSKLVITIKNNNENDNASLSSTIQNLPTPSTTASVSTQETAATSQETVTTQETASPQTAALHQRSSPVLRRQLPALLAIPTDIQSIIEANPLSRINLSTLVDNMINLPQMSTALEDHLAATAAGGAAAGAGGASFSDATVHDGELDPFSIIAANSSRIPLQTPAQAEEKRRQFIALQKALLQKRRVTDPDILAQQQAQFVDKLETEQLIVSQELLTKTHGAGLAIAQADLIKAQGSSHKDEEYTPSSFAQRYDQEFTAVGAPNQVIPPAIVELDDEEEEQEEEEENPAAQSLAGQNNSSQHPTKGLDELLDTTQSLNLDDFIAGGGVVQYEDDESDGDGNDKTHNQTLLDDIHDEQEETLDALLAVSHDGHGDDETQVK